MLASVANWLPVRLVYYLLQHKSDIYRFTMFEQASDFLYKPGLRLMRKCRRVLGDQYEYDSELSKGGER